MKKHSLSNRRGIMDYNRFENQQFKNIVNSIPEYNYPNEYPLHWHKYIEIAMILKTGENTPKVEINQDTYELQEGDIVFFWPGELHRIIKDSDCRAIGIQFSAVYLNEIPDFAPYMNMFRYRHILRKEEEKEVCENMRNSMMKILDYHEEKSHFEGVNSLICTYEIFIKFAEYLDRTMQKQLSVQREAEMTVRKIGKACTFIAENCETEVSLETAAVYVGFSSSYFSRVFKKVTGYHFVEYLTLQRVRRAQMLLSNPELTITDVCYMAGFKSSSSFNRAFLQYQGCSPSECRKYYLEK